MSNDIKEPVQRSSAGGLDDLREIYTKYKDDLLTVACCLVGRTNAAEDVLHDVFVRLAEAAVKPRVYGDLRAYLVASVANRARDLLRRRQREPVSLGLAEELIEGGEDPAARMRDEDQAERLCQALGCLPYEQREVIVLHLQGEMTFAQIAEQQAVSINTIQSRYRYGLEKMRGLLSTGVRT